MKAVCPWCGLEKPVEDLILAPGGYLDPPFHGQVLSSEKKYGPCYTCWFMKMDGYKLGYATALINRP